MLDLGLNIIIDSISQDNTILILLKKHRIVLFTMFYKSM